LFIGRVLLFGFEFSLHWERQVGKNFREVHSAFTEGATHIHVEAGEGYAKYWLSPVSLASVYIGRTWTRMRLRKKYCGRRFEDVPLRDGLFNITGAVAPVYIYW